MSIAHSKQAFFRYALLGVPLGCIGLPLYVHLPKYYSETLPLTLGTIGYVMFAARLLDCMADPFIGHMLYRLRKQRRQLLLMSAFCLGLGVTGLFYLPVLELRHPLLSLSVLLVLTYLSYSCIMIAYYSDGLAIASGYQQSARLSAFREASVITGVMLASILPIVLAGKYGQPGAYQLFCVFFLALLALCVMVYMRAEVRGSNLPPKPMAWDSLLSNIGLRWVFLLYFINAIATSITSTLFLFYVSDILKSEDMGGAFLGVYFLGSIASMPLWLSVTRHIGKRKTLLVSMLLAVSAFCWAFMLREGDIAQFFAICFVSGAALGGELTVLPSLLSDTLGENDRDGALEFGIWNFISKFNLALAAGIALPLLGSASGESYTQILRLSYAVVPCMFKLLAISILFFSPIERSSRL